MSALLKRADERATIWSAAAGRAVASKVQSEFNRPEIAADELGAIRTLVASFRITSDVRIDSEAATATEADADLLALALRGLIAMGGLQASSSDEGLSEVFRTLRVDRTPGGVKLTGQIPASVASRL